MSYVFQASEEFWANFYKLPEDLKARTRDAWKVFKANPFDPTLKPHKIHKLSAIARQTVWSVSIAGDLRVVFKIDGSVVSTIDIGTHDIYKG